MRREHPRPSAFIRVLLLLLAGILALPPHVLALYQDADGTLWVGTEYGGLWGRQGDHEGRPYRHDPADARSLSCDRVTAIFREWRTLLRRCGGPQPFLSRRHPRESPRAPGCPHRLSRL